MRCRRLSVLTLHGNQEGAGWLLEARESEGSQTFGTRKRHIPALLERSGHEH
jgi:hypothetical protein